jgi:hypothetical protein
MLTGDNKETAQSVFEELGKDGYFAEVLTDLKLEKIKELGEFSVNIVIDNIAGELTGQMFKLLIRDGRYDSSAIGSAISESPVF